MISTLIFGLWLIDTLSNLYLIPLLGMFAPGILTSIIVGLHNETSAEELPWWGTVKRVWKWTIPITVLIVLIPSKAVMYTMLGLRVGDLAMQTPTVQRVIKILDNRMDEYLDKLEGKTK